MDILKISLLFLVTSALIYTFRENKKREKKKKSNQKIYLLESLISHAQSNALLFILSYQIVSFIGNNKNFQVNLLLSFLMALAVYTPFLIMYFTTKILPQKKEEILKEVHPERKFI